MNDENTGDLHSGTFERVRGKRPNLLRLKVPGGWLVYITGGFSYPVTFYPDADHKWNPPIKK